MSGFENVLSGEPPMDDEAEHAEVDRGSEKPESEFSAEEEEEPQQKKIRTTMPAATVPGAGGCEVVHRWGFTSVHQKHQMVLKMMMSPLQKLVCVLVLNSVGFCGWLKRAKGDGAAGRALSGAIYYGVTPGIPFGRNTYEEIWQVLPWIPFTSWVLHPFRFNQDTKSHYYVGASKRFKQVMINLKVKGLLSQFCFNVVKQQITDKEVKAYHKAFADNGLPTAAADSLEFGVV